MRMIACFLLLILVVASGYAEDRPESSMETRLTKLKLQKSRLVAELVRVEKEYNSLAPRSPKRANLEMEIKVKKNSLKNLASMERHLRAKAGELEDDNVSAEFRELRAKYYSGTDYDLIERKYREFIKKYFSSPNLDIEWW